jgi:hypothetical protein
MCPCGFKNCVRHLCSKDDLIEDDVGGINKINCVFVWLKLKLAFSFISEGEGATMALI